MEQVSCLSVMAAADILSIASFSDPMIWALFLVAAQAAVWMLLRQSRTKPVPVLSMMRRPMSRIPPRSPWR